MISEIIAKAAIGEFLKSATKNLNSVGVKLLSTEKDMNESLSSHMEFIVNWSKKISFAELRKGKPTEESYIPLELSVMPLRKRENTSEILPRVRLAELLKDDNHLVILGQPGAGKTTSMKNLCLQVLMENSIGSKYNFPILIRLREINTDSSFDLNKRILDVANMKVENIEGEGEYHIRVAAARFLNDLKPILILEGFDEISSDKTKKDFLDQIDVLTKSVSSCKIIITSRTADFVYNFDNVKSYEISSLDDEQITKFAKKWLGEGEKKFLKELKITPFYDTAVKPLTIATLCAIYERTGRIPDKPKSVYKRIIGLLLNEWDEERRVVRNSRFQEFESDRKAEFLSRLSYELTISKRDNYFSLDDIRSIYKLICNDFGLKNSEFKDVINEIESHTGLFLQAGYDSFEFSHKSLQEYLAADYLVKLPSINNDLSYLSTIPNEIAIAITLSSDSSAYFCSLVNMFFEDLLTDKNIQPLVKQIKSSNSVARSDIREKAVADLMHRKTNFIMKFVNRLLLEKPDFNSSDNVCIALLSLYSMYYENCVLYNSDGQLDMFAIDSLLEQFTEFTKIILKNNNKKKIRYLYKIDKQAFTTEKIYILKLASHEKNLPEFLYCPESISAIFKLTEVKARR